MSMTMFLGQSHRNRGGSMSMRQITLNTTLEELTSALKADPKRMPTEDEVTPLVEIEFPPESEKPSAEDMDDAILKHDSTLNIPFARGLWIERFGNDMKWHLEPIRRTVRVSKWESPGEWAFFYKTNSGLMFDAKKVRAPKDGLARHFGMRPFLWQQFALYKLEEFLRFQKNHERDFRVVDYMKSANILFDDWLNDEKNADFKQLYDSKPAIVQEKLRTHIFSPFKLMQDIAHDAKEWRLAKANVSIYQYLSFLGGGWTTAMLVLFVQLVVPLLLFMYQVRESPRFPAFNIGTATSFDIIGLLNTDWETFCGVEVALDSIIMNVVIFIVYSIRVLPIVFDSFYSTVGDAPNMNSRLNSLRILIWDQVDDTLMQQLGFKLDRYMNSVYIAWVNSIMLIILYLTDNTVDVILNALAIEFLYNLDRDIPKTIWYDPGYRYLKASVTELVLRSSIFLEYVENSSELCEAFDIDKKVYQERVGGPLKNAAVAAKDAVNPLYMTAKDKIWLVSAKVASDLGRREGVWQFSEPVVRFGMLDRFIATFWRSADNSIFSRFEDCYTWSLWDEVVFLPPVPAIGAISTFKGIPSVLHQHTHQKLAARNESVNPGFIGSFVRSREKRKADGLAGTYWNYDETSVWGTVPRFVNLIVRTLHFQTLATSISVAIRRGKPHLIPFRILDGIFEWFAYVFLLFIFPIWLLFYLYLIIGCQPLKMTPGA